MDTVDVKNYMTKLRKQYLAKAIAALAEEDLELVKDTLEKLGGTHKLGSTIHRPTWGA